MIPERMAVIIPARDEEALLPDCLRAVFRAADAFRNLHPAVQVDVTVVLDDCRDASAQVAAEWAGVKVVQTEHRSVGRARQAGVAATIGSDDPAGFWVANTDADTTVPANWLIEQYRLAACGYSLVLGTVEPGPGLAPWLRTAWAERNTLGEHHRQVHGANLGVAGEALQAAGGFPPLRAHEDTRLVHRVKTAGYSWIAVDTIRAITSARLGGRTPEGFATYLAQLPGRIA